MLLELNTPLQGHHTYVAFLLMPASPERVCVQDLQLARQITVCPRQAPTRCCGPLVRLSEGQPLAYLRAAGSVLRQRGNSVCIGASKSSRLFLCGVYFWSGDSFPVACSWAGGLACRRLSGLPYVFSGQVPGLCLWCWHVPWPGFFVLVQRCIAAFWFVCLSAPISLLFCCTLGFLLL